MFGERSRLAALAGLASVVACGPLVAGTAREPVPASAVDPATPSAPAAPSALATEGDWVVRVRAAGRHCTGALVHPGVVLTAHHCVVSRPTEERSPEDLPPSALRVELGGGDLPWGEVGVRAVVAPPCGHQGGVGDVALLVLERRLVGLPTAEVRLDREPVVGEALEPVGFGRCALSTGGVRRHRREGGAISGVYATRFRMIASICPGDSGGPALSSETGEVVGVISAAVMDASPHTAAVTELTRLDAWKHLFARAFPMADGVSGAELPPIDPCPPS